MIVYYLPNQLFFCSFLFLVMRLLERLLGKKTNFESIKVYSRNRGMGWKLSFFRCLWLSERSPLKNEPHTSAPNQMFEKGLHSKASKNHLPMMGWTEKAISLSPQPLSALATVWLILWCHDPPSEKKSKHAEYVQTRKKKSKTYTDCVSNDAWFVLVACSCDEKILFDVR